MESLKYNKKSEKLEPYIIPASTNYKYKLDMGEWFFPIEKSVLQEFTKFNSIEKYNVMDEKYNLLLSLLQYYNDTKSEILLTNGSDNSLRLLLNLFATVDSNILVPIPSYVHFISMLDTFTVHNIDKPYIDYKLTNEEYYTNLYTNLSNKKYDLCYIVNPSMPIGHMLNEKQMENLLDTNKTTVFIVDEAYIEFTQFKSFSKLTEKYKNLIVVKTFSKFFSLASVRLGYLITNKDIIKLLYPYYNSKDITSISINCAIQTLKNLNFYIENKKKLFIIKEFLNEKLNELVINKKILDYILNEGMYFTIICENPTFIKKLFDNHSIAVRNKDSDIKGAIRITIASQDIMEKVINVLQL